MKSINPYTGETIAKYDELTLVELDAKLEKAHEQYLKWKLRSIENRSQILFNVAKELRNQITELSELITREMGKRIVESRAEVEKCAWVCEYYAKESKSLLVDEVVEIEGSESYVSYEALGVVLAVMPWNYPFWQLFRCAAPALMVGNTVVLKHASNVQGCALAIERIFAKAGLPEGGFTTLVISSSQVQRVIEHSAIMGVALTGSEGAGSQVAMQAGKNLKKSILELGGSDACLVMKNADIHEAARVGLMSRMLTSGQTCISAKRFIVEASVYDEFLKAIKEELNTYVVGDPMDEATTLAPLSQRRFAIEVHQQVKASIELGAECVVGGSLPAQGAFYPATLLTGITSEMPAYREETFGPVVSVIKVSDEKEAIQVANDSEFGLGAAVWSCDLAQAKRIARGLQVGAVYINDLVKSDPRLPFGGVKKSGYGRELGRHGLYEFCNVKSTCIHLK